MALLLWNMLPQPRRCKNLVFNLRGKIYILLYIILQSQSRIFTALFRTPPFNTFSPLSSLPFLSFLCRMNVGQNYCIFDENEFLVSSFCMFYIKWIYWWHCVQSSFAKLVKNAIKVAQLHWSPVQSCTEKFGCFSSCVLCSFSRINLKIGQLERAQIWHNIAHHYFVSNWDGAWDFDIRSPSPF